MLRFILTLVLTTTACGFVDVWRARRSGESRFSLPVGAAFVGFSGAVFAHFARTPLAAVGVVVLYALAAWAELRQERNMREAAARRLKAPGAGPDPGSGGPGAA